MKKILFIQKIIKEEKISLIENSYEIYESYSQKSSNSLKAAKILLDKNLLEESIPMSYYSMYHKLTALLYLIGIKCENHSASIILLKELFNLDNKDISFAKRERVDKQYYTDFVVTKSDVIDLIIKAEKFIAYIDDFSDQLTSETRNNYKKELKNNYF